MRERKKSRLSWEGGPPDYVWWLVTIVQLLSILVNGAAAIMRLLQ